MILAESIRWTPQVHQVLRFYPTAIKSRNWPEIARLANAGELEAAKELASRGESNRGIRARNVMARNLAIERGEFLRRIANMEKALRAMTDAYGERLTQRVISMGDDYSKLRSFNDVLHDETVSLRKSMRIWINAGIRDAARMGYRHMGNALIPIFKANREAAEREILADRAIYEGKLAFGLTVGFAARAKATVSAADVTDDLAKIIRLVTKRNLAGLNPSERVWELTTRAEQDLKRIVANGMAAGDNPAVTARKLKKYISPRVARATELGIETGPGVYRSPYKNAMRLARTEMNRTYTQATVNFTKQKPWMQGVDIVLSPVHSDADDCDGLAAGGPYSPEEAGELLPAHPHCITGDMRVGILEGVAALRSVYSGEIFEVCMADGRRLSITANHMMFTRRGFVKAQSLVEGDEILDGSGIDWQTLHGPNNHRMPARAADVFEALCKTRGMASIGMPVSSEHLHGDGRFCDGNVDIVRTDCLLRKRIDAASVQADSQLRFRAAYSTLPPFPGESQLREVFRRIACAFAYPMRGLGIAAAPRPAFSGHPNSLRLRWGTQSDTEMDETISNARTRISDSFADLLNRFAGTISAEKIILINRSAVVRAPVFDFHTENSVYLIEGLVSSNCMCRIVPRIDPKYLGEEE